MYGCTSGPNDKLSFNKGGTLSVAVGSGLCLGVEQDDPAGATFASSLQGWAKPLNGTSATAGIALLLLNPDSKARYLGPFLPTEVAVL